MKKTEEKKAIEIIRSWLKWSEERLKMGHNVDQVIDQAYGFMLGVEYVLDDEDLDEITEMWVSFYTYIHPAYNSDDTSWRGEEK